MEALFFRSLTQEMPSLLMGRRLERVHSPRTGWWAFRLQPGDHPRFLLFAHHPAVQALVLSDKRPENPPVPSARVMWLRKRVQGARIIAVRTHWSTRRMALGLERNAGQSWLILDAQNGVVLEDEPPRWDQATSWPSLAEIQGDPGIWKSHPHISPLLRKTLRLLPEFEARDLLAGLREDAPRIFVYESDHGPTWACPWRLPATLRQGLREHRLQSAMEAAGMLAEGVFFGQTVQVDKTGAWAAKKRARLLQRLQADEARMQGYRALARQAQLLQANLYQLPAHQRLEKVALAGPDGHSSVIDLDPKRTILENMEHWFRLADKGRRGLARIRERRAEILAGPLTQPRPPRAESAPGAGRAKAAQGDGLPVHRFLSSDGFILLRGKNQKANHALLTKKAASFDYWFHVEQGPGAHVILKRDHPGQEVPERTLREAAALAGLASSFSGAARAPVICAEVRHVRAVKGHPGLARVEKALCTLVADLDPDMETRLKAASGS